MTVQTATQRRRAQRARRAAGSFGHMTDERHPHDLYETPPEAVQMLLKHAHCFTLANRPLHVWDPSCGRGAILKALREFGDYRVGDLTGTDKHEYDDVFSVDRCVMVQGEYNAFEYQDTLPRSSGGAARVIVMNPPYGVADEHVRHALRLTQPSLGTICALLRFNWITAIKRMDLIDKLSQIIICGRLKMLPPGVEDKGHNGTVDFAWFVFGNDASASYTGRPLITRAV